MKYYLLLILSVFIYMSSGAQTCNELALQKAGKWSAAADYLSYKQGGLPMPAALKKYQAKMLVLMDSMTKLVKKALPVPTGTDGKIIRNIRQFSEIDTTYASYEWYAHFLNFYCSGGKIVKASETNTNLRFTVNGLTTEDFFRKQYYFEPYGVAFNTVPPPAGTVQGFPVYQLYSYGENPATWTERYAILITRNPDERPFVPVTKGEFYPLMRQLINKEREIRKAEQKKSTKIRPVAELEAALNKQLAEIDNSKLGTDAKNARKRRLKEDFRTDEQLLEEKYKQTDKQYDGYLQRLTETENAFKEELQRPVFLKEYEFSLNLFNTSYNQQHLFNDSLKGYMLAKPNPAYFKKSAERWKPQFILMNWRRENREQYSGNLEAVWRDKLDLAKLKSLLVK